MRDKWLYLLAGGIALVGLLVSGTVLLTSKGGGGSSAANPRTPPPTSTTSYGNADITATTQGTGYERTVVVRAKDKKSGKPIHSANVSVYGQMTSPHLMSLIPRNLHEVSRGTYKGPYTFIMQGKWTANVVVRTKQGGASTAAFPVRIGG